jgi:hypothetical protein
VSGGPLQLGLQRKLTSCRKFGKQIQRRQLDLPEYAASFVNYKALKKVWAYCPHHRWLELSWLTVSYSSSSNSVPHLIFLPKGLRRKLPKMVPWILKPHSVRTRRSSSFDW